MQHRAAVAQGPISGAARRLLTDEAILHHQTVVGKRLLVEEVPELSIERLVLVVTHLEQPIFDTEGVSEVVPQRMMRDLRGPSAQIAAVEECDPFLLLGRCVRRSAGSEQRGAKENATTGSRDEAGTWMHASVLL